MRFHELSIRGERWLAYPCGMSFPRSFCRNYPFRGRGVAAKILYAINRIGVDRVLLPTVKDNLLGGINFDDVAYFWPSRKRSVSRFYGYRVDGGAVKEYLKFGQTETEKRILQREAENVSKALAMPNRDFEVPQCVGMEDKPGCFVVRYEPLPEVAHDVPVAAEWFDRIDRVRRQIADAGYSHGDFSWHNFKTDGRRLWILDWEEMSLSVSPMVDEISLRIGYEIYWQKSGMNYAMKKFDEEFLRQDKDVCIAAVKHLASRKISPSGLLISHLKAKGLI